jgi:stalled ribosome alternative rescue factor ArfA
MSKRKANKVAKDLRTPKYKLRVEKKRKGKGSFKRSKKENQDES